MSDNRLTPIELQLNVRNHARLFAAIPSAVKEIVKRNKDVVLAGGAIRSAFEGTPANDYDIFFIEETEPDPLKIDLDSHVQGVALRMTQVSEYLTKRGFKLVFACPEYNLMTLKAGNVKIQLINRQRNVSIESILEMFDFSVCQFATSEFATLWTTPRAIKDVKSRRLSINRVDYPAATLNRLHKYRNYGYTINQREVTILCWEITDTLSPYLHQRFNEDAEFTDLDNIMRFYID